MKHILVVDDEPRIAEIARDYLERAWFSVTHGGEIHASSAPGQGTIITFTLPTRP